MRVKIRRRPCRKVTLFAWVIEFVGKRIQGAKLRNRLPLNQDDDNDDDDDRGVEGGGAGGEDFDGDGDGGGDGGGGRKGGGVKTGAPRGGERYKCNPLDP